MAQESPHGRRRLVIGVTVGQTLTHFVIPQVDALHAAGWDIHLVASGEWLPPPGAPVTFHSLAMSRGISPAADARALVDWQRLLLRLKPHTVLGSTPKAGLLSMTAARSTLVPRRVFLHRGARWETMTGARRRIVRGLDRVTMLSATDVLAVSPSLADLVVSEGLTRTRPVVLGAGGSKGVDLEMFTPAIRRPERAPTLGFLGRLSQDKGLETLLEVQRFCRSKLPETRLLIGGEADPDDPPYRTLLSSLAAEPGVSMLGRVHDAPAFFRGIDVLVFPSLREGLPNVVIEAAACGVPTVGWDVTGVRDAVQPGRSGLLARPGDQDRFSGLCYEALREISDGGRWDARSWAQAFEKQHLTNLLVRFMDSGEPTAPRNQMEATRPHSAT